MNNILNRGFVAQGKDDENIYCYLSWKTDIYDIRIDSKEVKNLTKSQLFIRNYNINVWDEWIYFIDDTSSGFYEINRVREGGGNIEQITDDSVDSMIIYNDWIYYITNPTYGENVVYLKKTTLDGSNEMTLLSQKKPEYGFDDIIYIYNDWIYFHNSADQGKLYKMDLEGEQLTKVSDIKMDMFLIEKDWIYYIEKDRSDNSNRNLYKMKLDGSSIQKVVACNVGCFNIDDKYIYFTNLDEGNDIYKKKLGGKSKMVRITHNIDFRAINIVNHNVYGMDDRWQLCKIDTNVSKKSILYPAFPLDYYLKYFDEDEQY